jgi:hypothetical protein
MYLGIYDKYNSALLRVGTGGVIGIDAAQMALYLALQEVNVAVPDASLDVRHVEWLTSQMGALNDWLEEYAPARYADPTDTATAVIAELDSMRGLITRLNAAAKGPIVAPLGEDHACV